jgi:hypothetical protein
MSLPSLMRRPSFAFFVIDALDARASSEQATVPVSDPAAWILTDGI